jgi:hypothetical protein
MPQTRVLWLLLPVALMWQSSVLAILPFFEWRLDPVLALVVLTGLAAGPKQGLWLGLIAGGCQDILVGAGLLFGVTKGLTGLGAGWLQPHIYRLDALSLAALGVLTTLAESLLIALYLFAQGRTAVWDHFAAQSMPLGLANASLLVVLYLVASRAGWLSERETG